MSGIASERSPDHSIDPVKSSSIESDPLYRDLARRLGSKSALARRLAMQAVLVRGQPLKPIRLDRFIARALHILLRLTGTYGRGRRQYLNPRVTRMDLLIPGLPDHLQGLRLLHLADTHFDLDPSIIEPLERILPTLDYDLCVHTGDLLNHCEVEPNSSEAFHRRLRAVLKTDPWCILGNHDPIEVAPHLETLGYRFLINEATWIPFRGNGLWLAGVDDMRLFKTTDFERTAAGLDSTPAFRVLLCHSPEGYEQAQRQGFDLMLSGHTHGGQICLPGGWALQKGYRGPRKLLKGAWLHHSLTGYTSRGIGGCRLPVRFFCPPEIALLTLTRMTLT